MSPSSSPSSVWTLLPVEGTPEGRNVPNAVSGFAHITKHLQGRSVTASKERVDLAALEAHNGAKHAQVESIPEPMYAELKKLNGVSATVLKPPAAGSATDEAVVMFADAFGAVKGLPVNKRATMIFSACGLEKREVRGDIFLGRLTPAMELGKEFAPQAISERDWLEASQAGNKAGGNAAFSATVQAWVKEASEKLAELAKAEEAKAPPPAKPVATDGPEAGTFTFTDNGDEVSVHVICPAGTKGKQVACVIKDATLKVEVTTLPSDKRVVLDGELFQEVKANDCTWHVEDMDGGMRRLVIGLEKKTKMTWLMLMREKQVELK